MRLLLDTHIFIWVVNDDKQLSKVARALISEASEVYVSSASILEAVIKIKLGKLKVDLDELIHAIEKSGFHELPITSKQASYLLHLPDLHRDPFDRILIAQAICEPLRFLTADAQLKSYSDCVELV